MEGSKEQTLPPPKEPLLKRLIRSVKHLMELNPGSKKYSLEDLGRQKVVAKVILEHMGNTLREQVGKNRWDIGFSIVTALSNMGYPPFFTSKDYFEKLSQEGRERYFALRQTLRQLSARETDSEKVKAAKPLLEYPLEEPDAYGETFYYRVIDEILLDDYGK